MMIQQILPILCVAATLLAAAPAAAELRARSFVSALSGNDTRSCAPTDPCRTFAKAISVTQAGGEIVVLDSGGYGPFTINKSINVVGSPSVFAAITVFDGAGITVHAGGTSQVSLRNLMINGLGGSFGIRLDTVGSLHIEDCQIQGLIGSGIYMIPAGAPTVTIQRVGVTNCTDTGIFASGSTKLLMDDVTLLGNGTGLESRVNVNAFMRNCVVHGGGTGIECETATNRLTILDSEISGNATAIRNHGFPATQTRVFRSVISDNGTAFVSGGGADIASFGSNQVVGNPNGADFTGAFTVK